LRTFGLYVLALQGQPAGAADAGTSSFVSLVARSSPLSKAVLLILILFSVLSWAIALFKYWQFRRAGRHSGTFLDVFRKSSKFSEVQAVSRTLGESPLTGIFLAGYAELNAQLRHGTTAAAPETRPPAAAARPTLRSLEALDRALLRAAGVEVNKLERRVPFLATTASITPFIGLFGTVWGILTAFQNIGATGSTSLGVVALPIAEALIATAAGLAAAIPAVYFYNDLTHRVKLFTAEMEDFSLEFLNIAERNFS